MKNIKIVFMGTPVFAAKILEHLIAQKFNIVGVVTQPDRQKDRKGNLLPTKVKEVAKKNNLEVLQPENIKKDFSFLEHLQPDLIITAAYGQIVPDAVLNYPKLGCINVHGSLLPKNRGGAPIHYAILNGDTKTGVSIMEMVQKMDAGNIISQQSFEIKKDDILLDVHDKMIEVAKELLVKTLPSIIDGSYKSIVQDEEKVTYSPTIKKEEQIINWENNGEDIYNKIRAFNPWPVAYSYINNLRFKFYKTEYIENGNSQNIGQIISIKNDGILIGVNGGILKVIEFQIQGRTKMQIKDFINGNTVLFPKDKFQN